MKLKNKKKQQETNLQKNRINELLHKYVGFVIMEDDEKIKAIRLCGILVYLEAAKRQEMNIETCIEKLTEFLDKLRTKYEGNADAV